MYRVWRNCNMPGPRVTGTRGVVSLLCVLLALPRVWGTEEERERGLQHPCHSESCIHDILKVSKPRREGLHVSSRQSPVSEQLQLSRESAQRSMKPQSAPVSHLTELYPHGEVPRLLRNPQLHKGSSEHYKEPHSKSSNHLTDVYLQDAPTTRSMKSQAASLSRLAELQPYVELFRLLRGPRLHKGSPHDQMKTKSMNRLTDSRPKSPPSRFVESLSSSLDLAESQLLNRPPSRSSSLHLTEPQFHKQAPNLITDSYLHKEPPMDPLGSWESGEPALPRSPRVRRQSEVVEVGVAKSHRVPCTRAEYRQAACLNGKCYALDLGDLRQPFCECPAMYEGARCELLSTYYFLTYSAQLKTAAIIGGLVIGVIIIIVVISVYCSVRKGKKKRRERNNAGKDTPDGTASKHEQDSMIREEVNGNADSKV